MTRWQAVGGRYACRRANSARYGTCLYAPLLRLRYLPPTLHATALDEPPRLWCGTLFVRCRYD